MKNDRYLKIILTIIAICLVWICVRDIKIGGNYLFARVDTNSSQDIQDVRIVDTTYTAFYMAEPISVRIDEVPRPENEKNKFPNSIHECPILTVNPFDQILTKMV